MSVAVTEPFCPPCLDCRPAECRTPPPTRICVRQIGSDPPPPLSTPPQSHKGRCEASPARPAALRWVSGVEERSEEAAARSFNFQLRLSVGTFRSVSSASSSDGNDHGQVGMSPVSLTLLVITSRSWAGRDVPRVSHTTGHNVQCTNIGQETVLQSYSAASHSSDTESEDFNGEMSLCFS